MRSLPAPKPPASRSLQTPARGAGAPRCRVRFLQLGSPKTAARAFRGESQGGVLTERVSHQSLSHCSPPSLSCRVSLFYAFRGKRGSLLLPPTPSPAPCNVQVRAPAPFNKARALSVALEPGLLLLGSQSNLSLKRHPKEGALTPNSGKILIHFEKSLAPRIGRQSTELACPWVTATSPPFLPAGPPFRLNQVLQLLPSADPALSKDLGVEGRGLILGGTPSRQALSEPG